VIGASDLNRGSTQTDAYGGDKSAAPTILVVDDITELVEELVEMLSLTDIPALGASTLAEAIAELERAETIRVVICDVRLTRESGLEIIGRVKAHPVLSQRLLQYVFITGDPLQSDMLDADFDGLVLAKPVQPRALIECLQKILSETGERV
jgi:CheY-like chemotaxis protein